MYTGYVAGAMYQGRLVANSVLNYLSLPPIAETYLNAPFPVSTIGYNYTTQVEQPPFELNLALYLQFARIEEISNEYKDKIANKPDDDETVLKCMEDMVNEINDIFEEPDLKPYLNSPLYFAFIPYQFLQQTLQSEIEKK